MGKMSSIQQYFPSTVELLLPHLRFFPTKDPSLSVANTTLALGDTVKGSYWKGADDHLRGVAGVKLLAQICFASSLIFSEK